MNLCMSWIVAEFRKAEDMLLQEMESGSRATILVGIGSQTLAFDTTVEEPAEDGILTQPIYRDEKLVGFKTKGLVIRIQITNASDNKVYEFMNVEILNVKTQDEQIHHKITCKLPGKQINRRTAVRVWVGIEGIAQIGIHKTAYEVLVKDISISGISFIFHKDLNVDSGTLAHIVFNDSDFRMKFSISSIIVRKEVLKDGRVLYGCRMNQESQIIAKYVNDKQRAQLKGSRTVGTKEAPDKKANK